jgi:hypothetical protein
LNRLRLKLMGNTTLERCPNLRIIVPQAGGTLPFLARRIEGMVSRLSLSRERGPSGVSSLNCSGFLRYGGVVGDNSTASLLTLVDSYGSDYPFKPEPVVEAMINELNSSRLLTAQDRRAMEHGNAMKVWARAFISGTAAASCDHARMLAAVKVSVLYTHHFRNIDPQSGMLIGAASDQQAACACELMRSAAQRVDYRSFPSIGHRRHSLYPQLFVQNLVEWTSTL